jgi:hypothetical protein
MKKINLFAEIALFTIYLSVRHSAAKKLFYNRINSVL